MAYYIGGLFSLETNINNINSNLNYIFTHPLENWWNTNTPAVIGVAFIGWLLFVSWYITYNRNFLPGKEDGSAQWADPSFLNKKLALTKSNMNRIITQNIKVGLEGKVSNNNMCVVGAPGTGKTMFVVTPNILLAIRSYVILDVKGDLSRKYSNYFKYLGYKIKILNLKNLEESDHYNPFRYIQKEEDIPKLVTNLLTSTTPPDAHKGDPFWDDGCALYLQSMLYYIWLEKPKSEQTMNALTELVNAESRKMYSDGSGQYITVSQYMQLPSYEQQLYEEDENMTELSRLMNDAAANGKHKNLGINHPAYRDYWKLKGGAPETVRSIILMINAKLKFFESPGVKEIFNNDDMDLEYLGSGYNYDQKTKSIIFLVIPENDTSYNFIIGMFYQQLFDTLIRQADSMYHGSLPIGVDVYMDEFANGARPERFENLITTLRSRNIAVIIFLQSISQIKTIYKENAWDIIMDACSIFLFLGAGRGALSTQEYISKLLDNATIDKRSDSVQHSKGTSGSISFDKKQRALMTPGEVGTMPRTHCIALIEGCDPVKDRKYQPFDTPTYKKAISLGEYTPGKKDYKHIPTMIFIDTSSPAMEHYKEEFMSDSSKRLFDFTSLQQKHRKNKKESIKEQFEDDSWLLGLDLWNQDKSIEETINTMNEELWKESLKEKKSEPENKKTPSQSIVNLLEEEQENLTEEQKKEILLGIQHGLSDEDILLYFHEPAEIGSIIRETLENTK